MNVTFMIGNGFDLNCGLRTSYINVYEGYCKTESTSNVIATFKKSIDGNYNTWADFELGMRDYMTNLDSEEDFLSCFYDFQEYMIDHIKGEEKRFSTLFDNTEKLYERACKEVENSYRLFYTGISRNIDNKFSLEILTSKKAFICFNYTNTLDILLKKGEPVIHVHGTLTNDPIVGIDNEAQFLKNLKFIPSPRLKRAFIKPILNEACDTSRVSAARKAINEADVICIYGLSLGESDLTWKALITDWLTRSPEHHLFVYDFKWSTISHRTAAERFEHEDEARACLLNKLEIDINEHNALTKQVHIPCGRNIFNVKGTISLYQDIEKAQIERAKEQEESNRKKQSKE